MSEQTASAACAACGGPMHEPTWGCVKPVAAHLRPTSCYVCGASEPHASAPGQHAFWSNAAAAAYFAAEDQKQQARETKEARYVRQHRPY